MFSIMLTLLMVQQRLEGRIVRDGLLQNWMDRKLLAIVHFGLQSSLVSKYFK